MTLTDAALDAYYADKFESAYGYDPLEGPHAGENETEENDGRTCALDEDGGQTVPERRGL